MRSTSIQWEIGNTCNLRCKHCFIAKTKVNNSLSLEEEKTIIDYLIKCGIEHISFSTREPFINSHFLEILKYCELKNIMVTIITNGTLITDEYIQQLYRTKIKCLGISLEGVTKITNDSIRGKGTFELVLKNFKKIRDYGIKVKKTIPTTLQITLTNENCEQAELMHDFFKVSNFGSVNLGAITPVGNAKENSEIIPDKNKLLKATDIILKHYSRDKYQNYYIIKP